MERISEHVWWMKPGPPDRPSLCAVVGERWTVALDAGSSRAHTRVFLDGLPEPPSAVVYTHSHWDHVFGAVEIGGIVIAHRLTVPKLEQLASRDWSDEALASYRYADDIKQELPSPRVVEIAPADIVFDDSLDVDLGGVTVHVEHVGGDHCDDACIAFVEPDGVLFLSDAVYPSPDGTYTSEKARPLFDRVLAFDDARLIVEGHHDAVSTRDELRAFLNEVEIV